MKNQYEILAQLKRVDEKVARLQNEADRIPEEIAKLEKILAGRKAEFSTAKNTFDTQEKTLRKAESDLKDKEEGLRKAEGKMMEVKTNEEYQAALKENQGQKGEKGKLEETVLSNMGQMEEHRVRFKEAEKVLKAYETTFNADKATLDTDRQKVVNQIEQQIQLRNQLASQLSPEVSTIYQRVVSRTKGVSIVSAENGMCQGCNRMIQPQLYNEILGKKTVHKCQNCAKILLAPSQEAPPDEA